MSTFSGLVLGVVSAAVVTVIYGDQVNRYLRDRYEQAVEPVIEVSQEVREAVSAVSVSAESANNAAQAINTPGEPVLAIAELVEAAPPRQLDGGGTDDLQQRWASYREQARTLVARGDFPHRRCFMRAAAAHAVPETLLLAVAKGESNFDSAARSAKDAIGLMQIQWPGTSHHLGVRREADLYDPCTNVDAGARYLAQLSERYQGDLHRVLGAYNYGPGRISEAAMPQGARWYSQYIYQHLQQVLGRPHVASSELLAERPQSPGGHRVLMTFNHAYRARDYIEFLRAAVPGVELAQRSERLGLHEVVLLYQSADERASGLELLRGAGLLAFIIDTKAGNTL